MSKKHFAIRANYSGDVDFRSRIPELSGLESKKVAVIGLGSIGAPIALELARAGVGTLVVWDGDAAEAANACRWPFGVAYSGIPKASALKEFIDQHFIWTKCSAVHRRFGTTMLDVVPVDWETDRALIEKNISGVDMVVDATAEEGVMHLLSDWAWKKGIDYISVTGTFGGWGGEVVSISPQRKTGCWICYMAAQAAGDLPMPPVDEGAAIQPRGCASPTFTASGFDMLQVALVGVRTIVSRLCSGSLGAYPPLDGDVSVISLRNQGGQPQQVSVSSHSLRPRPECEFCGGQA